MSLLFTESFDGIGTTPSDYVGKWTAQVGGGPVINAANGRNGNGSSGSQWAKAVDTADEHATFILGFALKLASLANLITPCNFYSDSNVTRHIYMDQTATGELRVFRGDGTQLAISASGVLQAGAWHYIEVKAVLGDGTSGSVIVRVDGVQVISTGGVDTKNGGTKTVFDTIRVGDQNAGSFDDIVLLNGVDSGVAGRPNNDFLGDVFVEALDPDGNGNYATEFDHSDGNDIANDDLVNEADPDDDTTYVESGVDDAKESYTFEATSGTGNVAGVAVYARAKRSDTDSRDIALLAREGGTDAQSADQTLAATYAWHTHVFEAEPDGSAWTLAEVDGAEFGVVSRPT